MLGDDAPEYEVIIGYLVLAGDAILARIYDTFSSVPDEAEVPDKYTSLQCQLAVRYISRRGAEGETSHNENGISRTWDSADDTDLLRRVMPLVALPE